MNLIITRTPTNRIPTRLACRPVNSPHPISCSTPPPRCGASGHHSDVAAILNARRRAAYTQVS